MPTRMVLDEMTSLKRNLWHALLHAIERRSGRPLGAWTRAVSLAMFRAANNAGYNFDLNGERRVVDTVLRILPDALVFDVGAHHGHWSVLVLEQLGPSGRILAFEPFPENYATLKERTAADNRISVFNVALSDHDEIRQFVSTAKNSQKGSLESGAVTLNSKITDYATISVEACRGDTICRQHDIEEISLLKIDTEGHDLAVLRGFAALLLEARIDVVQFEYSRLNIYSRSLLLDIYAAFQGRYRIGRVYPNRVDFKDYEPSDETFIDGNYVAVRSDRPVLIAALSG